MEDNSDMKHKKKKNKGFWSLGSIFMHADGVDLVFMVLGLIGSVGDGLGVPLRLYIVGKLMNDIGNTAVSLNPLAFRHNINKNALVLCYFAAGSWIACFIEGYCWTRTAERQASRMRTRYLRAVLRQDVGYFDLPSTSISDVITSITNDSLTIQDCISDKVPNFLMNTTTFIGGILASFLMLWRLAIVGFPFVVLLVVPGLIYGRILMGLARKVREEYVTAGNIAEQAISCIRTVYAFVGEVNTMDKFSRALEGSLRLGLKQGLAKGLALGSNGIAYAISGFYAWYGSRLVMYEGAQGGTVQVVEAVIVLGGLAFGTGLSNLKYFSEAASAAERIIEVVKRVPKIDSKNMEGLTLENVSGEVKFNHVHFTYPSRPDDVVLQDFSLHVSAGKTMALVGGSGSGKSTTIALLQRFYDPVGGEILLDGVAIDNFQLKWLRSQMGLVSQEPALFSTTIKENILFGNEDATTEDIIEATCVANAHNFINQLPEGYDTQVGELGIQLSGGQKQRIAIARAIIKKPRILLLDEATSALDSESERVVQEALDKVSTGRTTIIIAHRLSTIKNADSIAIIQNGMVMEIGSHNELTQIENGFYASLVGLQTKDKPRKQDKNSLEESNGTLPPSTNNSSLSKSGVASSIEFTNNCDIKEKDVAVPSFRRLLTLNLPEWKQGIIGCLSALVNGAVLPLQAYLTGSMISIYFLQDHEEIKRKTMVCSMCFVGLSLVRLVANVGQHYNFSYMGECLTKRIREHILAKILTFEVAWFDQEENSTGALCSRLAKDANQVRSLVGDRIALLVQVFSAVAIAATLGLMIAWKLAIVLIAVQPLVIVCHYTRLVLLKSMSRKAIKAQAKSSKLAADAVYNHRTITSFSAQDRMSTTFVKAQTGMRHENIIQSCYTGLGLGTSQCLTTLVMSLQFWYGGKLLAQGHIDAKSYFETSLILAFTGRAIADAGSMTSDLAKGKEAVRSIFAALDRMTQIKPEDHEGHHPKKLIGHVEFCGVDFAYPTRPDVMICRDFTLEIEAGKSTALVGQSGSGKSTIISLIERFYDPVKGQIKIDGQDIRSYSLRSLRMHLALVSQEPTLFGGTIRENITFGASDKIDESEVVEAAQKANAHDFISSLKDGYNTFCGDKGVQLSGGQKQRIAIARAILKNPRILLLDEATSALDVQSEKIVQDAIECIMDGRTTVVVAHRLSTIQDCDLITVLDKGQVIEKGSHSSLLAKGPTGAYYSLFNFQTSS